MDADPIQYCRKPCAECPWRKDVKSRQFKPARFRLLANTSHDLSFHLFTCHKSEDSSPVVCAGFLLQGAAHNLAVRFRLRDGSIDLKLVSDGGYPMHKNYRAMALANGVRSTDPALRNCRDDTAA